MKYQDRKYPGKLLLFGEYSILKGGGGLALPLTRFSGSWQERHSGEDDRWLDTLYGLAIHLGDLGHVKAGKDFQRALEKGLRFQSDIPLGYGAGSSGALTAAVYGRFVDSDWDKSPLVELRDRLARIEDFFHGSSSGLDPLISLTGKSMLIHSDGTIRPMDDRPGGSFSLFLLDTGKPRKTDPLVRIFHEKCLDPKFEQDLQERYIPLVDRCIESFLSGKSDLYAAFRDLSAWQLDHLPEMIPEEVRSVWLNGLDNDRYYLKLCGAGGGGYMTGLSVVGSGLNTNQITERFGINWLSP